MVSVFPSLSLSLVDVCFSHNIICTPLELQDPHSPPKIAGFATFPFLCKSDRFFVFVQIDAKESFRGLPR